MFQAGRKLTREPAVSVCRGVCVEACVCVSAVYRLIPPSEEQFSLCRRAASRWENDNTLTVKQDTFGPPPPPSPRGGGWGSWGVGAGLGWAGDERSSNRWRGEEEDR